MDTSFPRWLRPFAASTAITAEMLLLPLFAVGLGIWINPLDPLWVRAGFPWAWFAPVILALRYGPFPGLGAAGVLLLAWVGFDLSGWIQGDFPKINFLGGLILVMIAGEFSSLWVARTRRAEGVQLYLDQRLDYLTRQYYLLRLSHDRLEQDLIARPMAMRDALAALHELPSAEYAAPLPGASQLLRMLGQYCQIDTASLHAMRDGAIDPVPVATLGKVSAYDAADLLLEHAREKGTLAHIAEHLAGKESSSRYLVCAPLNDFDGQCIGMLLVERIPFFALNEETLQTLNLFLGYYADGLLLERAALPICAALPQCPHDFAAELQRLWHIRRESLLPSVIVALEFPLRPDLEALAQQIARQKRGLDVLWEIELPQRRVLATLMPLAGKASAEGYIARIESWVHAQRGGSLADAGILGHVLPVDEIEPVALLRQLLESNHAVD